MHWLEDCLSFVFLGLEVFSVRNLLLFLSPPNKVAFFSQPIYKNKKRHGRETTFQAVL